MDIIKLHPEIAAEIRGVSMADVVGDDDVYRAVRAAFEEHSVLLFRNQPTDDQVQVGYSAKFGPLETAKVASLGEGTPFSILTNIDSTTGDLVPPTHKEALRAKTIQLWHTDSSFRETPALASVLSARTIRGVGGETEFVSQRATWNHLPESLRAKLANSYAWHSYEHIWRAGDIIMWDNRASMHRGRPWPLDKPRYMIRTTIAATDADGVAELRPPRMAA